MTSEQLYQQICKKRSFLCVGLDSDLEKIPPHLLAAQDPLYEFNKAIIDATADYAIAYKPNLAFYEYKGIEGWQSLIKTVNYIRKQHPEIFLIADAKRGDIGNTARMYAKAFFQNLDFDAITISPYMGKDSVLPFLEYESKWVIVLTLTSNEGHSDFQLIENAGTGRRVFEEVITHSTQWGNMDNLMFVVGATHPDYFSDIRRLIPDHFLLVPGVGEQGGSLQEVTKRGLNNRCGLIVNSSRSIIYTDRTIRFAEASREAAKKLQLEMEEILISAKLMK